MKCEGNEVTERHISRLKALEQAFLYPPRLKLRLIRDDDDSSVGYFKNEIINVNITNVITSHDTSCTFQVVLKVKGKVVLIKFITFM